ncbi:hypothetical protein D3C85_1603370 [compost metagenome]
MLVDTVASQAVIGDGHQGPQEWQVRPQPVMGADVGALKLARARCPQAFPWIVGIPDVEVPHLRAYRGRDAEHMTGRYVPSAAGADGYLELFDQRALVLSGADAVVEGFVHLQG